ncbi:peptidase S9B dipeptidylpeptidase IV domain protein [Zymomonas mobilis subsp. pomaceae ATCC 29192]|uniref:Peptidase S9B dipeptidylpeptidase IV domain protein n=2 Tax=Zymomonas mobilis TaxID=542 RepID=F8EWD6_ZYMMT|nr:peptidase S9B dipeptidylpeptidase IV domain protein [Zymomonas mobilis subsp. pomaceae ATCC 29192]
MGVLAAVMIPISASAANLTLDRIFASPSLSGPTPRSLALSPDGHYATLLRPRADDLNRYDLWAIDTRNGKSRMLIDSKKVGSGTEISEAEKMRRERARVGGTLGIVTYNWSPDGHSILVPLDGDLYLATLNGSVRRMTDTPSTEVDAQVSAAGHYLSFVRDQNLFVIDLKTGHELKLSHDGGDALTWGSAEFVAQEEMARNKGHWWAPDDSRLAVARVDESKVHIVTRAAIGAEGTKTYQQRYPAAGTPNAKVDLYLMNPDGSDKIKVDLGDNDNIYLARVTWAPDSKTLYVQRESRDQQHLDVLKVDATNGQSRVLFSETAKSWINLNDDLRILNDGSLIWASERSGFRHLYRWKEGQWTTLTEGDWMTLGVVGVNQKKGQLYFLANKSNPLEQHLYSIDYEHPKDPTQLTESGWYNTVVMDKEANHILINRSNVNQPPQVYLADTKGHPISWIEENKLDARHPYSPYLSQHVQPKFGTLSANDGTTLYYKLLMPKMEQDKQYPVLVQVYNGPDLGRQVLQGWTSPLHQYLVAKGWIIFSIDGRGSPGRGKAFEDHIYKAMGTVEVEDQLTGLSWLKAQNYVDPKRIAVFGWSYGGYMVQKLLQKAPGQYAAGVSGAPVIRWGLYDTHYTERFLGNPAVDPTPYEKSDALPEALKLSDPMLLIHGMADDNVVFDNSVALISKLQEGDRPFEFMAYPGETHRIAGEKKQLHLWHTIEKFLDRTTKYRQ